MVILNDSYIDSQIELLDSVGFDTVFNSDNFDILLDYVSHDSNTRSLFSEFVLASDQDPNLLSKFCKSNLRDFLYFVCFKYCSLDWVYDFDKKSEARLQAELVHLLESNKFRYMNEVKRFIKSDSDLLDIFCDEEFNSKLREYLFSKRLLDDR